MIPFLTVLLTAILAFLIWWLIRPGGILERWGRLRLVSRRIWIEDALKYLHTCEYERRDADREGLAEALQTSGARAERLIGILEAQKLITRQNLVLRLTEAGRDYAVRVVRAHRVWERYLADETGLNEANWHREAHRREHRLTDQQVDLLAAGMGNPAYDPHGDPIPTAAGELPPHSGQPLTSLRPGDWAVIVHVEDEPEPLYTQLVAAGMRPGVEVQLLESAEQRVRLWTRDGEQALAPAVAGLLSVLSLAGQPDEREQGELLANLNPGETAIVRAISLTCRRHERRRLMDLGILPGTVIEAVLKSPGGDPTAYRVRGALIALREEQSRWIYISREVREAA
ncbi:MAG: FeoA domain-containing protein [Acidobacteriota bacterium]